MWGESDTEHVPGGDGARCVTLQACNILVAGISSPEARNDESSMCTDNVVCALGKVRIIRLLEYAAAHSCSCIAESSVPLSLLCSPPQGNNSLSVCLTSAQPQT